MTIEHYQKMYAILCGAADRAIDLLSTPKGAVEAKTLLEQALRKAEEVYLSAEEPSTTVSVS